MRNLARFAAGLIVCSACAAAADPPFIFTALADPSVYPVIEKYFRGADFVGVQMVKADPRLGRIVDRQHQFDVSPSLTRIAGDLSQGCGVGTPGAILYNLSPDASPQPEMTDPIGSIASAAQMIRASGCDQVGILPYGQFWGAAARATLTCQYDLGASAYQQVNWAAIDRLDIQGEWLLSDDCIGKTSVTDYVRLVSTVASYVRGRNPRIAVFAQLSFRFTPPSTMVQSIQEMSGLVDGFLLSYPLNPANEHKYCTAQNLEAVLSAFRSGAQ
jgi:hypothetical protein